MIICSLCLLEKEAKSNTHYLTDGIIKLSLNFNGNNSRANGFHFSISSSNPFIEYNFQQSTPPDKLESIIGRLLTEIEISNAKYNVPFSVNDKFCWDCEKIFTSIETKFQDEILPKFRNSNLEKLNFLNIKNVILARLFFYLQVWRSAICTKSVILSPKTSENLRIMILDWVNATIEKTNIYPLSITYLETLGEPIEFTKNRVGFIEGSQPVFIFFNDFIIQFFENGKPVIYSQYFGLNNLSSFHDDINLMETDFRINILHNKERTKFNHKINTLHSKGYLDFYRNSFLELWYKKHKHPPNHLLKYQFLSGIINNNIPLPLR